ncbi:hypothetical protein A3C17_04480 [Candidatus Uhrbacteria bacterium RIFCSPHIGHO2_02_FULL_53_13]|uniref:HTH arsR-type domain-containing protein n=1 Tax=Candidatus Uhrbacteria bacterium RIFCSPHIGHO2_02_FULL_53_13 TaxID=1802389 RepID=A0A1F7U0P3_9BACT|nr:MAG: hypothetical protein A3C17_04480 [Candidatus Uhrbacteria bacterium RIFCSPHIGHO2_02_FULL_53_13]
MAHQKEIERFGVEQLFGSKTRSRLLQLVLNRPSEPFFVREMTRKIDAQLNSVRREIGNLVELGLLKESESTESGDRKKYYTVNTQFSLFEEMRALFLKAGTVMQQDLVRTLVVDLPIQIMVLTGVFVGKSDAETDMLIVGTPDPRELQKRVEQFEGTFGRELNYTVMPPDEYLYRRDISDRFLSEIFSDSNIVIHDSLVRRDS